MTSWIKTRIFYLLTIVVRIRYGGLIQMRGDCSKLLADAVNLNLSIYGFPVSEKLESKRRRCFVTYLYKRRVWQNIIGVISPKRQIENFPRKFALDRQHPLFSVSKILPLRVVIKGRLHSRLAHDQSCAFITLHTTSCANPVMKYSFARRVGHEHWGASRCRWRAI